MPPMSVWPVPGERSVCTDREGPGEQFCIQPFTTDPVCATIQIRICSSHAQASLVCANDCRQWLVMGRSSTFFLRSMLLLPVLILSGCFGFSFGNDPVQGPDVLGTRPGDWQLVDAADPSSPQRQQCRRHRPARMPGSQRRTIARRSVGQGLRVGAGGLDQGRSGAGRTGRRRPFQPSLPGESSKARTRSRRLPTSPSRRFSGDRPGGCR